MVPNGSKKSDEVRDRKAPLGLQKLNDEKEIKYSAEEVKKIGRSPRKKTCNGY